jgi:hypothetical protein
MSSQSQATILHFPTQCFYFSVSKDLGHFFFGVCSHFHLCHLPVSCLQCFLEVYVKKMRLYSISFSAEDRDSL